MFRRRDVVSRRLVLLYGLVLAAVGADHSLAQTEPVFLVRHAERAAAPSDDPPLTEAGQDRAAALAAALRSSGITAIFTSAYLRTQQTAAQLAKELGVTAKPIGFARGVEAHIAEIANAVREHRGGAVLVVGHSNTVPAIIGRLGGPKLQDLCETTYDLLFTLERVGSEPKLSQRRYGAASAPPGAGCL
jgi:broad specificity phosphatase PhoE